MPVLSRLLSNRSSGKLEDTAKTKVCSRAEVKRRKRRCSCISLNNIQSKVNAQEGNTLPVSAFKDYVDGSTPSGTAAYEKRGIAVDIPVWQSENVSSVTVVHMYVRTQQSVR